MKIICIDYDGSYTEFPELFECIINKCKELKYSVICATMRYPYEEDEELKNLGKKIDKVIYTSRNAKLPFLLNLGIEPDLWIDDNPKWLLING